jgi:3-hydroxyisobutyrate dehydrogenase-like beta-hydroxyacid dehydrogenase
VELSNIGILHPGAMGSSVGAAARAGGVRVLFASEGRAEATRRRGLEAGLEDAGDLATLLEASDCVVSVCPPHAALALAQVVAGRGFRGVYADVNAVAPATAREIGRVAEGAGASFVDGGIVGPPARQPGTTRLYLSGEEAPSVASLFASGPLEAIVLEGPSGAASALKVCFASYTKGSTALLAAIRALAVREGVGEALLEEWKRSMPGLADRSEAGARSTAPKAWRFVGEMEEIASAFAAAGLPDGFHLAAAELYRRLAVYKDAPEPPQLEEVIRVLLSAPGSDEPS